MLRAYTPALYELLRSAHWAFARKQASLTMLADATGQTSGVQTAVIVPWVYEYAYPIDCLKMRFVAWNYQNPNQSVPGNISLPTTPITTGGGQTAYSYGMRLTPAPFLEANDPNYTAALNSNWESLQGTSPWSSTVILTNVNQAQAVYTAIVPQCNLWDAMFQQTFVDLLTSRLALALAKDQKMGLAVQGAAVQRLKGALDAARAVSANEMSFPQTTDNIPDFIRTRRGWSGGMNECGAFGGNWSGPGTLFGGWDGLALGNGTVY